MPIKTIITVDDAATMRKMISFTLKGAGHDVIEAGDGVEALKTLQMRQVDLVLTDVNMPNMDGITLTRSLRALPQFAHTPCSPRNPRRKRRRKEKPPAPPAGL